MDDKPKPTAADAFLHAPMPYYVRVRAALGDDATPRIIECRTIAYSVFEACLQAVFEAGGTGIDAEKYRIERVHPDYETYAKLFLPPAPGTAVAQA